MHVLTGSIQKIAILRRFKIIEGQIRGLQKMVVKRISCMDVLNQILAARQALASVENLMIEDYLNHIKDSDKIKGKEEILKMYHLKRAR